MIIVDKPQEKKEIEIKVDSQYNKLMAESVKVAPGVTVRIYGIINKALHVGRNAVVHLHGQLKGELRNDGGEVNLY